MHIVMFYHSLISDWNHGNAHFLRGIASEALARGHRVTVYEPHDAWSLQELVAEQGMAPVEWFHQAYPTLASHAYDEATLDLHEALEDATVVLVHEWNTHELVERIGRHRHDNRHYRLFFHDTHHRAVTDQAAMAAYDLSGYDGVLAFGEVIREMYVQRGWAARAWTWHEAADTRIFHPVPSIERRNDLVWIGNWGDGERTRELHEFVLDPARELGLSGTVHGVRYPVEALQAVAESGLQFGGWVANFLVPSIFASHRFTVHVPRGPYVRALAGIPTIRPFEALACGIPLISAPWEDREKLFRPGEDFLVAQDGEGMKRAIRMLRDDPALGEHLAAQGLSTIRARHTCAHRVDELLAICAALDDTTSPRIYA